MPGSFPLNPCDYLFFAHHTMMQRSGQTGNLPFMIMDVAGDIPADELTTAVDRTLRAHPALRSKAGIALVTGWPRWRSVDAIDRPAVTEIDLRHQDRVSAERDADERCQAGYERGWDVWRSPQVEIELYRLPGERSRLCVRWPHGIMDADGAQWFMSEVNRLGTDPESPLPPQLHPDHKPVDPLAGMGLWSRYRLFRAGLRAYADHTQPGGRFLSDGLSEGGRWRFIHHVWDGDDWTRLRAVSAKICPDGPARFSRYLGACVLRALATLYAERGVPADAWLITLPMRVRGMADRRPVPGNYLVSATLTARRDQIADKRQLTNALGGQIADYIDRGVDRANWALVWAASWLRAGQYRWYLSRPRGLQPYASGFSCYGEIDPPVRSLLGRPVTNFWGSGSMSAPPGWNPVFSRFGDRLNFGLSYLDGYFTRATAERFMRLVGEEMFEDAD